MYRSMHVVCNALNVFVSEYFFFEAFHYEVAVVTPQIVKNYRYHVATEKNPSSSTDPYELHVPSGYSYYIVSSHPELKSLLECYHGPNVVERFNNDICSVDELGFAHF